MEVPPDDDCCPVCHSEFYLPCRTSCSHWFCGECILLVWMHGNVIKRCRCPLCCHPFSSLTPFLAAFDKSQDHEATNIIENVKRYNRLHIGGVQGLLQKLINLLRMAIRDVMDPDKTSSMDRARIFAFLLGLIYVILPFDFLPYENGQVFKLLDYCAIASVTIMHLFAFCRRARRLFRR